MGRLPEAAKILVHVMRGEVVESVHRGHVAVVNSGGDVLASTGDPEWITFWRSAAKPVQVLPLVLRGIADRRNLNDAEIALMCGSHAGQDYHVATARSILAKAGIDESALQCGAHPPMHGASAEALAARGEKPQPVHNNCSGKHAGMLTLAKDLETDISQYLRADHPVCGEIKRCIHALTDLEPDALAIGTDGCGVPVYGLSVVKMAQGYARLATPASLPERLPTPLPDPQVDPPGDPRVDQRVDRQHSTEAPPAVSLPKAAARVARAMTTHPEMVAGDERICTDLMRMTGGRLIAKGGAEAVYCVGLTGKGIGIAMKSESGSSRGVGPAIIEILRLLGVLDASEVENLAAHYRPVVHNVAGTVVGEVRAALPPEFVQALEALRHRI